MNHLYKTDYKGIPLLYLFLRSPLLCNIVLLLVFSLFSGLLGACVLGLSFWLRKRKIILFLPLFFIIHVLDAINVKWLYMAINGETSYVDTALLDYVVPSFSNGGMSRRTVFLFSLLFGNSISEFLGPGCSMFFVRLSDRRQWVWGRIARIYMLALAYTGLYLTVEVLIAMGSVTEPRLDRQLCLTVIELMMLLSLVFTVTCLLANVVSIRCGTAIGIFSVFILVMLLETVGIMLFDRKLNVILNPFCFHSGIVNTPSVACMKIAIDLFYALIVSTGTAGYISHMDIW